MIDQVARRVRLCARFIPEATCLTQAISAQILLRHEGIPSTIRFGVAGTKAGQPFRAHAWLECDGRVILGGEVMSDFTPLPDGAFRL